MNDSRATGTVSTWSPLRRSLFRWLWIATIASNIGTWIHEVGADWLMTSLSRSPILVSLADVASNLPLFLLAIPAGALADVFDRRRLLLFTQAWMLASAATLGVLTITGITTPAILLVLTFVLGLGAALNAPAWQATTPELVPRDEMPAAILLGSIAMNVARAVGPAIGGFLVASAGPGFAFLLNATSFLGVVLVVASWRRPPHKSLVPGEHVLGAMRAGIRYVRHAPAFRIVLVRAALFMPCASVLWALLALLVRHELGLGAASYGLALACLGVGAVAAAFVLPRVRRGLSLDAVVAAATVVFAAALVVLGLVRVYAIVCVAMFGAGVAWLAVLSSLNVAAQSAVPSWVRARAMSVYLLVFFGGLALGSTVGGVIAAHMSLGAAFVVAAAALVAGLAGAIRWPLSSVGSPNVDPSRHWPEPHVAGEVDPEAGPVLVTLEYRIDPSRANEFLNEIRELRRVRRRDGAIRWAVYRDTVDPARFVELFVVDSWGEHLRQHERVTFADRDVEDRVRRFQIGEGPRVEHFVSPDALTEGPRVDTTGSEPSRP